MKKTIRLLCVFLFSLQINQCLAQNENKINWLTWEQILEKYKEKPRKILLYFEIKDSKTYQKTDSILAISSIKNYINDNFYTVKLTSYAPLSLGKGKQIFFERKPSLQDGCSIYSSNPVLFTFLDENLDIIGSLQGDKDPKEFALFIKYYASGASTKMPFPKFEKSEKRHR